MYLCSLLKRPFGAPSYIIGLSLPHLHNISFVLSFFYLHHIQFQGALYSHFFTHVSVFLPSVFPQPPWRVLHNLSTPGDQPIYSDVHSTHQTVLFKLLNQTPPLSKTGSNLLSMTSRAYQLKPWRIIQTNDVLVLDYVKDSLLNQLVCCV